VHIPDLNMFEKLELVQELKPAAIQKLQPENVLVQVHLQVYCASFNRCLQYYVK
jgi:hypothetical protein